MTGKTKQRLIAAAFGVSCFALGFGLTTFAEWAAFVLKLVDAA